MKIFSTEKEKKKTAGFDIESDDVKEKKKKSRKKERRGKRRDSCR